MLIFFRRFDYSSEPGQVVLGLHEQGETTAIEVGIEAMYIHEEYDNFPLDSDIMLIRLDRDVTFNDKVTNVANGKIRFNKRLD